MNVGQLKRALENIPDDVEVTIPTFKPVPSDQLRPGQPFIIHLFETAEVMDGYYVEAAKFHRATSISNDEFNIIAGRGFGY